VKFLRHIRARMGHAMTPQRSLWAGDGIAVLILLSLLLRAGINDAQAPRRALPTMVTASAIHRMTPEDAARGYPVRLQAVVTYFDPSPNPRHSVLFVADESGSIYVALSHNPIAPLKPADLVEITGVTSPGEFAPVVDFAQAHRIGTGQLPATAPRVDLADMAIGEVDGQWVEIEGVVHAIRATGKHLYLDIALRDGDITAMTLNAGRAHYEPLIDATVRLRGNEGTIFNDRRQLTGAHLLFPGTQTLRVEAAAPAKAFDLPLKRIDSLLRYSSGAALHHREHVQGVVTLDWPGRLLCIADGETQGLCAQIEQTEPLHRGDQVDLAGFPQVGAFTPTMSHAIFRSAGTLPGTSQAVHPITLIPAQALSGRSDAELVTIEGRLIGHDLSAADPTIVVQAGKSVFLAVLPPKYAAEDLKFEEGSLLRITGVCSNQSDGTKVDNRSGFPIATSFRVLLDSPRDVTVLEMPSWWNARHTLGILAIALLAALAGLTGVLMLSQRVKRQNGMIRGSEERFRHLATHDGLTQLPNRASVLNSLEAALTRRRLTNTSVCVALIDLDHFKNINDTFGHVAGDEVLREAARRLSSAIRSTDVIGRYGGEEFLIVFDEMEQDHGVARSDLVRRTLCEWPVRWEGKEIAVTCSIGVAASGADVDSASTLVSSADHAMYAAKMRGRNRVVSASEIAPESAVHPISWPIAAV
jgi:diguanylate cyclase (GGDEF)-like protein